MTALWGAVRLHRVAGLFTGIAWVSTRLTRLCWVLLTCSGFWGCMERALAGAGEHVRFGTLTLNPKP